VTLQRSLNPLNFRSEYFNERVGLLPVFNADVIETF